MVRFCIIVYVIDQKTKDYYLKIFRKKISYEGLVDTYRNNKRFISKRNNKERKRIKKHTFRKHIYSVNSRY